MNEKEKVPDSLTVLPDPKLFRAARVGQRISLGVTAIAVLFGLLPLLGIHLGGVSSSAARLTLPYLITSLLCVTSLVLSESDWAGTVVTYAGRATNLLLVCSTASIFFTSRSADGFRLASRFSLGFVALALVVLLLEKENWLINRMVDVLVCGLCFLCLLLVSDAGFGRISLFGKASGMQGAGALLACLLSLTVAVALRQAEHGVFSIFLGVGVGSKLARAFAPILIVLPFLWAAAGEGLNRAGIARHLNAALAASAAVAVAVGFLMQFTWHISRMENQIHDLVLRDEATRFYNFRGFQMLAEHALRLAQRANTPFSVLYVDIENLAEIHTELGPNVAASALAEAGEILRATFRESDIKGRIGADSFAVAGQFDRTGISVAALRLEAATAARSARSSRSIPIKLSMGHVTTSEMNDPENLRELLERASQVRNRQESLLRETVLVN